MNTFEITIQKKRDDFWPVVVERRASNMELAIRDEGVLFLDKSALNLHLMPLAYGIALGKALFRETVRDAFIKALEREEKLHVMLEIEDDELRFERWERLCAPLAAGWNFLGLNQNTPFALHLPSLSDRRFPPISRADLRALILVADPADAEAWGLARFDAKESIKQIQAALGEIPSDVLAYGDPKTVGLPTLDDLCRQITAECYTFLHIICHGAYTKAADEAQEKESFLYLANASNKVAAVTCKDFLNRLGQLRGKRGLPHFTFLCACDSAVAAAWKELGGLAQRCVHDRELGMPAVLAMTEKISIDTAQQLTEAFYRQLRNHGEPDAALVEACAGLASRDDINVPALYSRLCGRPLFSTGIHPLNSKDIETGLQRMAEALQLRAPVLLNLFDTHAGIWRGSLDADAESLSKPAQRERDDAMDTVANLCEEALDLRFPALALGQKPPEYDRRCPFRGLYPFGVPDREAKLGYEFFFGRETLIAKMVGLISKCNFLAVLGASGSGKSSVVLAGVVPALKAADPTLQTTATITPGINPPGALETALKDKPGLKLLVVDQFEELFTLCTVDAKRREFVKQLLSFSLGARVIVTMRADFWGDCAGYEDLKLTMQKNQELIAPMDSAELRRVIDSQAGKVGLRFEAGLSNSILDKLQGEPGAMPLLQHALKELWKRRHGCWLTTRIYLPNGKVAYEDPNWVLSAIGDSAEAVFLALETGDQKRAEYIFVRLTRLGETAGADRRDTRQRVKMKELVPTGSDPVQTIKLVNYLADVRLVVTSVNATTGDAEVEVVHEALIRYWPRLGKLLDENPRDAAAEGCDSRRGAGI